MASTIYADQRGKAGREEYVAPRPERRSISAGLWNISSAWDSAGQRVCVFRHETGQRLPAAATRRAVAERRGPAAERPGTYWVAVPSVNHRLTALRPTEPVEMSKLESSLTRRIAA